MLHGELHAHGGRANLAEVCLHLPADGLRVLSGYQAAAHLGDGVGGDNGLGAGALITAGDAVELQGRAGVDALRAAVAGFCAQLRHAREVGQLLIRHTGHAAPALALPVLNRGHAVVETLHGHAVVGIVRACHHFAQGGDGVGDSSAENAGVQVHAGSVYLQLKAAEALESVGEGGDVRCGHAGVAHHDDVAGQFLLHLWVLDEAEEALAAALFLALQQVNDVEGQGSLLADDALCAQDVGHDLALVIRCTSSVHPSVPHGGGEGITLPSRDGVHGHHVVVPVDEHGGLAFHLGAVGHHNRVDVRKMLAGREAQGVQLSGQEVRAAFDIGGVLRQGGDTRNAQKGE